MESKQQRASMIANDVGTHPSSTGAPNRRQFVAGLAGDTFLATVHGSTAMAEAGGSPVNIARVASPTSFTMASEHKVSALNDGFVPANSFDRAHGLYVLNSSQDKAATTPWVQYEWSQP